MIVLVNTQNSPWMTPEVEMEKGTMSDVLKNEVERLELITSNREGKRVDIASFYLGKSLWTRFGIIWELDRDI